MNRVIKFRAWDKEGKSFANIADDPDYSIGLEADGTIYVVEDGSHYQIRFELSQFTGLLDVKGNEIYEGDIVIRHPERKYGRQKVAWEGLEPGFNITANAADYEVIGNVWENPELLTPNEEV